MSFEDYIKRVIDIPQDCREPFCPFGSLSFGYGYCDVAYSEKCRECEIAKEAYSQKLQAP